MTENNEHDISFEQAQSELEEIVKKIETGDLSLNENLKLFERGIVLTRLCSSRLEDARQRIETLVNENTIKDMEIDS